MTVAQTVSEFKLLATFDQGQTKEAVYRLFKEYLVLEVQSVTHKKFVVIFRYRDPMIKAMVQVRACSMQLHTEGEMSLLD